MRVHDVRPAARELRYQLYGRALHPELFDVCATKVIEHSGYDVVMRICEAGHLVELRRKGETVTEVSVDEGREIPERGRCLSSALGSGRDLDAQPLPDVAFQASIQLETLDRDVFEQLSQEFHCDARSAALSHVFCSRNRLRPEAISLIFAECGSRSLGIHTFHTFPDEFAIIRTQSLFEFDAS